jgi:hypothetical protein
MKDTERRQSGSRACAKRGKKGRREGALNTLHTVSKDTRAPSPRCSPLGELRCPRTPGQGRQHPGQREGVTMANTSVQVPGIAIRVSRFHLEALLVRLLAHAALELEQGEQKVQREPRQARGKRACTKYQNEGASCAEHHFKDRTGVYAASHEDEEGTRRN